MRPVKPSQIEMIDDAMADVYRKKTSAERLAIAHDLWRYARQRIEAAVRWQFPQWNDDEVRQEVNRRLLRGSGGTSELSARRP
jgi:hypothetical protein